MRVYWHISSPHWVKSPTLSTYWTEWTTKRHNSIKRIYLLTRSWSERCNSNWNSAVKMTFPSTKCLFTLKTFPSQKETRSWKNSKLLRKSMKKPTGSRRWKSTWRSRKSLITLKMSFQKLSNTSLRSTKLRFWETKKILRKKLTKS